MAKPIDIDKMLDNAKKDPTLTQSQVIESDIKPPQTDTSPALSEIDVEQVVKEVVDEGSISEGIDSELQGYDVAKKKLGEELVQKFGKKNDDENVEKILDHTESVDDKSFREEQIGYNQIVEGEDKILDDVIDIDADGNFVFKMASQDEIDHLEKVFGLLNKGELQKSQGSINNFLRNSSDELFDIADYTDVFDINIQKKTMTIDELESLAAEIGQDDIYFAIRDVREKGGSLNQAEIVRGMWEVILLNTKAINLRAKLISGEATHIDEENYKRLITQRSYVRETVGNEVGDAARIVNYQRTSPEYNSQLARENREHLQELEEELANGDITLREFAMFEADLLPYQRNIFKKGIKEHLNKPKPEKKKAFSFRAITAELYINAKLSAPITHLANVTGNALWNMLRFTEYAALAGIETAQGGLYKALGVPYEQTHHFNELMSSMAVFPTALVDGGMAFGTTLKRGKPIDGMDKIDLKRTHTIGKQLLPEKYQNTAAGYLIEGIGYSSRLPTTLLSAEDEFFKAVVGKMELAKIARRKYNQALKEGFSQEEANTMFMRTMRKPNEQVKKQVKELAREGTFTRELPPGFFKNIQDFMNAPEVKMFVPFYKTLVNIGLETWSRTPIINFLEPRTRLILKGNDEAAKRMIKVKMMSGSAMLFGTAQFTYGNRGESDSFFITGAAPTDPGELEAFRRKNYREYSVMVKQKDGSYIAYDYKRLDPFGQIMGMSADYAYTMSRPGIDSDSEEAMEMFVATLNAGMRFIEDQPLTDGVEILNIFSSMQGGDASEWFANNWDKVVTSAHDFYIGTYTKPASALQNQIKQMGGQGPQDYSPTSDQIYEYNEDGDVIGTKPFYPLGESMPYFGMDVDYATGEFGRLIAAFHKARNRLTDTGTDRLTLFATPMPGPEVGARSFTRSYREQDSFLDDTMNFYAMYLKMPRRIINGYRLTREEYDKILRDMNSVTLNSEFGAGKTTFVEELERLFRNEDWKLLAGGEDTADYRTPTEQREHAYKQMDAVYKKYYGAAIQIYEATYPRRAGQKNRILQEEKYGQQNIGSNIFSSTQPE